MASATVELHGLHFRKASYISFTDIATNQIVTLLQSKMQHQSDIIGILVTLNQKGCAGLAYKIEYARPNINIFDKYEIVQHPDFNLFINPKISLYLIGTQMNFKNDRLKSGFEFENPNSKGSCGCGESFFV